MRFISLIVLLLTGTTLADERCPPDTGVALQILGSGGPIADDGRASTGYLVWIDGAARIMIDAGAGTFLRYGEADARFEDLDFFGLSHFHTDHSADFPALLKSGNFSRREQPIVVAGPDGSRLFPGLNVWLNSLLNADDGAFGYLSGYLDGEGRLPKLEPIEVSGDEAVQVFESNDGTIRVDAIHVPHGIVPALGFRVRIGDETIVFATDQNGTVPSFVDFASDADLLVMHLVIPEDAGTAARRLHARPSVIGEVANAADAKRLVLSHFMARSLRNLDENVELVEAAYDGEIVLAEDLLCLTVEAMND
ncbi:MAG: MBL fold metallo-hydrolase [Woeseiaceae bacterium]|nr:MBL fold metallo-hydrolase [Woeseiaceae bacterium]